MIDGISASRPNASEGDWGVPRESDKLEHGLLAPLASATDPEPIRPKLLTGQQDYIRTIVSYRYSLKVSDGRSTGPRCLAVGSESTRVVYGRIALYFCGKAHRM